MPISMRDLFSRREIPEEIISLRNSLANHLGGLGIGLRQADTDFRTLNTDDGNESGCRRKGELVIGVDETGAVLVGAALGNLLGVPLAGALLGFSVSQTKFEVGTVLPAWVPVDVRDHRRRPRTLEGVLVKSKVPIEDFPLKPWHTFYDWNFFVHVDPQYAYLLNENTRTHHSKKILPEGQEEDIIECEWDSAFLPEQPRVDMPLWAIPQVGSRVLIVGRWIFDCGHPDEDGQPGYRIEIHPIRAIVSFRKEAVEFEGNNGSTQANNAVVYIGRKGGYIDQPINDMDYAFDLYLPPKPHPQAEPQSQIVRMTGHLWSR